MPAMGLTAPRQDDDLEDACLGIDIGSYRTRVCIWIPRQKKEIVVESGYSSLIRPSTPSEFPSALYVFDTSEDIYLPRDDDDSRRWVSAKYVLYSLAKASDTMLEQYPAARHLMERKDEPEFGLQLRKGMTAMLSALRNAVDAVCRKHGLRIAKIGLTIPERSPEIKVYCDLVGEVFEVERAHQISLLTETETLLRYLCERHTHKLDPHGQHNAILFFDFGGHRMCGCLFRVIWDQHSPSGTAISTVESPFGAAGGSDAWEHHISQWFFNQYLQDNGVPAPLSECESFLSRFRPQKRKEADSRKAISIKLPPPDDDGVWQATLTEGDINRAWEQGLSGPLRTAERELSRLVEKLNQGAVSNPLVVVSGGTARNPTVESFMRAQCSAKNIPVVFTDEFDFPITHSSTKVAMAAAYVVSVDTSRTAGRKRLLHELENSDAEDERRKETRQEVD